MPAEVIGPVEIVPLGVRQAAHSVLNGVFRLTMEIVMGVEPATIHERMLEPPDATTVGVAVYEVIDGAVIPLVNAVRLPFPVAEPEPETDCPAASVQSAKIRRRFFIEA